MQYRRDYTASATYFFTIVTFRRSRLFDQPEAAAGLRAAFRGEMARRPFYIGAIVIMPEHIHAIWTLPPDDADYSIRWRKIKRSLYRNHSTRTASRRFRQPATQTRTGNMATTILGAPSSR